MRIFVKSVVGATALAVILAFAGTADAQNKCLAGKIKCVSKKKSCLTQASSPRPTTRVFRSTGRSSRSVRTSSTARPIRPRAASRSSRPSRRSRSRDVCAPSDDTAAIESMVDAFVLDVVTDVDPGVPHSQSSTDARPERRSAAPDARRTGSSAAIGRRPKLGVAVDTACLAQVPDEVRRWRGSGYKGCIEKLETQVPAGEPDAVSDVLDDTAAIEAEADAFDADVLAELSSPGFDLDTRRCTGNTRTKCTGNADCSGVGGTCEFYFGTAAPALARGVSTLRDRNQVNGTITGTADVESGPECQLGAARLPASSPGRPQPPRARSALGDAFAERRDAGRHVRLWAEQRAESDINGSVLPMSSSEPRASTVRRCREGQIADTADRPHQLDGYRQPRSLSTSSPNCRAPGFTGLKCFCDTCNNAAAQPCGSNADCPDPAGPIGPICGGRRCSGGSQQRRGLHRGQRMPRRCPARCPAGATATNQCDDTASARRPAATKVTVQRRAVRAVLRSRCDFRRLRERCRLRAVCGQYLLDREIPRVLHRQRGHRRQHLYRDRRGRSAGERRLSGPTLAAIFCVGPTASSAVNSVAGTPGLGRLELPGHGSDNGTAGACPTEAAFLPDAGSSGVLDPGWTGQSHDARVVSDGKVTVGVTGCASGTPPCGVCTYTGPIPNANIAP